jgi:hypothetical protein
LVTLNVTAPVPDPPVVTRVNALPTSPAVEVTVMAACAALFTT